MTDDFEYDVFLSYSSKDGPAVRNLAERLRADGLRVWLDEWCIKYGDDFVTKIGEGVKNSRILVQVMSPNGFGSKWATKERNIAICRDPDTSQNRFIPLLLADCDVPEDFAIYHHIDYRQATEAAYQQILAACRAETSSSDQEQDAYLQNIAIAEQARRQQARRDFTQHVRQKIKPLLDRKKLRRLRESLLEQFADRENQHGPERLLVPYQEGFDIDQSIYGFRQATQQCLQRLADEESLNVTEAAKSAIDIFGWLVLLAVSDTWLQKKPELLERLKKADHIEIPVSTPAAGEVAIASLHDHQARFKMDEQRMAHGKHQIGWGELEMGLTHNDSVTEIKKLIWKTVLKVDAPGPFTKTEDQDLQAELEDQF